MQWCPQLASRSLPETSNWQSTGAGQTLNNSVSNLGETSMATKDPWVDLTWTVYDTDGTPGGIYLGLGDFTLEAIPDSITNLTAYYRVIASGCTMPSNWPMIHLFPRGS